MGLFYGHNQVAQASGTLIKFGLLYNYATVSAEYFAPEGWHMPTEEDFQTLIANFEDEYNAGSSLVDASADYWNEIPEGTLGNTGFNARGAGYRAGSFTQLKTETCLATTSAGFFNPRSYRVRYDGEGFIITADFREELQVADGRSVRLIKNTSDYSEGETLTDVDGNVYPLVKIGEQVWTAVNWACTKLSDNEPIQNITDMKLWQMAFETPSYCAYDNDSNNIYL